MKKQLLLFLAAILPIIASADAVEIDGIYYNLVLKAKLAEVTSHPHTYSGNVVIPETITYNGTVCNVTSIGDQCFSLNKNLTSVVIPNSVTTIGVSAFWGCSSLTSVIIPDGVISIEAGAFKDCSSLTEVTLSNSLTSIRNSLFQNCSCLKSISIGNNVTSIESRAFANCRQLTSVTIPNSMIFIGSSAFSGCSQLTSITIPNSVTSIESSAFYECSQLTSITIGSNIKTIRENTFSGCTELSNVYCYATNVPSTYTNVFTNSFIEYATLYVPASSINAYKEAIPWNSFKEILPIEGYTPIDPSQEKCAIPKISYEDGQLLFTCDTEAVTFVSEITNEDIQEHNEATIPLTMTYTVSVYAVKDGMSKSDVATATLSWNGLTPQVNDEKAKYHLSFVVDNSELSAQSIEYGAVITVPATTDNEGNDIIWYAYPETMPAHDLVVYGMVVKQPEPEVFVWLTVKDGQGTTRIKVKQGAEQVLTIMPEEGWKVVSVMMDGTDVTAQVSNDGSFTTAALMQDAMITVVYEQNMPTDGASARLSQANIKVVDDGVVITNAEPGTRCTVYAANGQQVVSTIIDSGSRKITLAKGQVYVLTLGDRTLKFAL